MHVEFLNPGPLSFLTFPRPIAATGSPEQPYFSFSIVLSRVAILNNSSVASALGRSLIIHANGIRVATSIITKIVRRSRMILSISSSFPLNSGDRLSQRPQIFADATSEAWHSSTSTYSPQSSALISVLPRPRWFRVMRSPFVAIMYSVGLSR